jgi:hypothetical protein
MSKSLFTIDSFEKERILEMHQTALKNNYLNEQSTAVPTTVPTTVTPTKMNPLTTDKIILSNGSDITLESSWNQKGTESKTDFTVYPSYSNDTTTGKPSTNRISISFKNNQIGGLNIGLVYDCITKEVTPRQIQLPQDVNLMKNVRLKLMSGGSVTQRTNTGTPGVVQNTITTMIKNPGFSTTQGPVSEIIAKYCKTK